MDKKCIMIVDGTLSHGLIVNTIAVLAATLAKLDRTIIGGDVYDLENNEYHGIVTFQF